jgi:cysteine desulfurase/selenocysteine lyase
MGYSIDYNMDYGRDYNIDYELIRRDFPLIQKKKIYMNNGAVALTPISTIKAITDFILKCSEEGPTSESIEEYITKLTKELRIRLTHLINCQPEEIVFTQSTTEGINYISNGIEWKKGDSIVIRGASNEHYANYLPWLYLSKRKGVKILELNVDDNGYFELGDLERSVKKQNSIKLITLSHALYNNGAIMPVEEVGKIAKENNILYCLDSAQTIGSLEADVRKIGCDFMAFPGFKWLCGPLGIGVFYCNKNFAELLSPQNIGRESVSMTSDNESIFYSQLPNKFEAGFRNYPGIAGMESSLRYILRLGVSNIRKKNIAVAQVIKDELAKIPSLKIYGPEDQSSRTSIVSFSSTNVDAKTIVDKLQQNEIILAQREIGYDTKVVRASPHFFNSEEEAENVVRYVGSILK